MRHENGLAALQAGRQYYYVRRDGAGLPVVTHDNGPDYFADGLTPARVDGRIGSRHRPAAGLRHAPRLGLPVPEREAGACNGCHEGTPDAYGHAGIVGGMRFRVDRQGNVLPDSP